MLATIHPLSTFIQAAAIVAAPLLPSPAHWQVAVPVCSRALAIHPFSIVSNHLSALRPFDTRTAVR